MSDATTPEINAYALSCYNDAMDADAIVDGLRSEFGLSLVKALRAFKKFQITEGLVLSNAAKAERSKAIIEQHVSLVEDTPLLAQATAVRQIADEFKLSNSAARRYVQRYLKRKKEAGTPLMVTGGPRITLDISPFTVFVKTAIAEGLSRTQVAERLVNEFAEVEDLNKGKRIYGAVARKHSLLKARENIDFTKGFQWLEDKDASKLIKSDVRDALLALDYSVSAANRFFKGIQFMLQLDAFTHNKAS